MGIRARWDRHNRARRARGEPVGLAERFRANWPAGVLVLVAFVASEVLDDASGDKSLLVIVVSVAIGAAVYAVIEWARR
jgi:hypothetical protein